VNDPCAHLTPKPLEEQVPGAWNFVEPNPNAITAGQLVGTITAGGQVIKAPEPGRLMLSRESRELLLERVPTMFTDRPVLEREWKDLEEALADVVLRPGSYWMPR